MMFSRTKVFTRFDFLQFYFPFPGESIFNMLGWSDGASGAAVLTLSLLSLCICLVLLVKVLRKLFSEYIADIIKKTVNSQLPYPFGFLTGKACHLFHAYYVVFTTNKIQQVNWSPYAL